LDLSEQEVGYRALQRWIAIIVGPIFLEGLSERETKNNFVVCSHIFFSFFYTFPCPESGLSESDSSKAARIISPHRYIKSETGDWENGLKPLRLSTVEQLDAIRHQNRTLQPVRKFALKRAVLVWNGQKHTLAMRLRFT